MTDTELLDWLESNISRGLIIANAHYLIGGFCKSIRRLHKSSLDVSMSEPIGEGKTLREALREAAQKGKQGEQTP